MFRDDLGAANARIAALEAKIAELEAERASMPAKAERRIADLERQLEAARNKAAQAEQAAKAKAKEKAKEKDKEKDKDKAEPKSRGSAGTGSRERWAVVRTVAIVAGLVAVLGVYLWYSFRSKLNAGEVNAAYWLTGDSGPELLLVIEAYEVSGSSGPRLRHRLELRDGHSGQRSARVAVGSEYVLVGVTPGGVWFASDDSRVGSGRLHRRDRHTLAVTVTEAAWRAKNPSLGQLSYLGGVMHAGGFPLRSDDGRYYYLDPETLVARAAPALDSERASGMLADGMSENGKWSGVLADGSQIRVQGAERKALQCGGALSSETLLQMEILNLGQGDLITAAAADSVLVTHRVSLSKQQWQLSLMPCQGPPRWTIDLPGEVDGTGRLDLPAGQVVFVAKKGRAHVLMAVGVGDGVVRWRQAL